MKLRNAQIGSSKLAGRDPGSPGALSLVVRAQLRFLWRARGSMLSALLGMMIGVASITGVHLLSAQIAEQVRRQAEPVASVDLYLQRTALVDDDYFSLREAWRAGDLSAVAAVFPLLEGSVEFADQTLLLTGTDPLAMTFPLSTTSDAAAEADSAGVQNAAAGARIEAYLVQDSVYLSPSMRDHADIGDVIGLGNAQVVVLGHSAPEGVVLADLPTARAVLNSASLSRVGVVLTEHARTGQGWPRLRHVVNRLFPGALPAQAAPLLSGLEQITGREGWTQVPAANANPLVQLLQSVLFNVAMLSMLALVVAWLLTYQVAWHALGRRRAMFTRLQSLGVARSRLRRLTLVEGVVLGLFATLFGVLLGIWLANLLYALMRGAHFAWVLGADVYVLLKALGSGVGVAGCSYVLAARNDIFERNARGAKLPDHRPEFGAWLWLAGLVTVFLLGLLVPGTGLPGAFACILCCALLLIVFLPRLASLAFRASLTGNVGSSTTRPLKLLGRRQVLVGQELRLGISALTLALATALGISVMVDSFRGAFVDMLDRRLADDAVLVMREPAEEHTRAELEEALKGRVRSVLWRGVVPVQVSGAGGRLEFAENFEELLERFIAAPRTPQSPASDTDVFVNESFARLQNLRPGQALALMGKAGSVQAVVRGIFTDYGEIRPRVLGTAALAGRLHGNRPLTDAYVTTHDLPRLSARLEVWLKESRLQLRDQGQVRARSLEIFEQTFAITRALTWLALLVAVVALANALAAHSLQQAGTDRQLRVLGVSHAAARRLRLSRTSYATVIALLLAVPLGFAIAALLCGVVNPRAFGWSFPLRVTLAGVSWPLLGGILGGVLASALGLLFARRQMANPAAGDFGAGGSGAGGARRGLALTVLAVLLAGCGQASEMADARAPGHDAQSDKSAGAPALRVGTVLGGAAEGFARATAIREFEFPRDHGAHPEFRSEWWYLTCPLRSDVAAGGASVAAEAGSSQEYGVQFTLFRQGLTPGRPEPDTPWRAGQVYMAHAALTSVAAGQHVEASRFARGHPRLAGTSTEPFAVWLENWRFEAIARPDELNARPGEASQSFALQVEAAEFSVDLDLQAQKPLVLQGDRGLSYKGSREASYYYSIPRLAVTGRVALGKVETQQVAGSCWFDREWSTSVLAEGLQGWDWFALQFDDQTEMMLFQLRAADTAQATTSSQGKFARRQGKAVDVAGEARSLPSAELHFEPLRYWRDETGIDWPVAWHVTVAGRQLRVEAALDDQRMRETLAYWEGLVWVYEGDIRVGQGYLEMTGYSGAIR